MPAKTANRQLTAKRARELFAYDKANGALTWRTDRMMPKGRSVRIKAGTRAGSLNNAGYRMIWVDGRCYASARVIWLIVHGRYPIDEVDHRNGRKSDDRWSNLREATRQQNCFNKKVRADSGTGVKGVRLHQGGKYEVRIQAYLGLFRSKEMARAVYARATAILHREFANTTGRATRGQGAAL